MLSDAAVEALVVRHRATIGRIIARSAARLFTVWDDLGSWNREDVAVFARLAAPIVAPARASAVSQSVGFYAAMLEIRPPAVPAGFGPEFVAETPFTAVWHAFAQGRPFDEAIAAGRSVTEAHLSRIITSTSRLTGDRVAERSAKPVRWRRVTDADPCSFCATVAGQLYLSSESADFGHDRCSCTAVPVSQ